MVKYELFGFRSLNEYIEAFMDTLLQTNKTYDYFVDWTKVKNNARRYIKEINLLNALTKVKINERKQLLREIFSKYPEAIPVIPLILAVREKSISVLEITDKLDFVKYNFGIRRLNEQEIISLITFCEKTGILSLFDEINDLYAYIIGVEVGLDSNTRKNRSGAIFQSLVEMMLKEIIKRSNLGKKVQILTEQDIRKYGVNIRRRDKTIDFILTVDFKPKIIVECNFYNVSGSKPIEVAAAYIDLNRLLKEKNITFIWITDGPAWRKMRNTIIQAANEIDFLLNLKLTEKYLPKILPKIIT